MKSSKKPIFIAVSVVLILIVVGLLIWIFVYKPDSDCCPEPDTTDSAQAVNASPLKGIDGELEFTVTEISCGQSVVGDEIVYREATGEFCLVFVQVKNNSAQASRLFSMDQFLITAEGESILVDTEAQSYITNGYWYENIPAEDFASGTLVWDVPVGGSIDAFQFSSGVNSEGVRIER